MTVLFAAAVALPMFFLVLIIGTYARYIRRRDLFSRMQKHKVIKSDSNSEENQRNLRESLMLLIARIASPFADYGSMRAWDVKMRQAGIPLLGGEFIVAALLSSFLVGIGIWMLFMDELIALIGGALNIVLFRMIVSLRVSRRRNIFTEQLGDALTTVANALRAGYSFQQSIEVISNEMEAPISEEFAQVVREVSMGVPLEVSLESMNQRVMSSDFELVVTAVIIQREIGGNLAQILDTISETINERIRIKREVYALTAQGRLSALILLLLPFGIGFFMYCANPTQITMLFYDPMGRAALAGSFVLELIGVFVINRIVNIKV